MSEARQSAGDRAKRAHAAAVVRATVTAFFVLLWLPLVAVLFGDPARVSRDEQRFLTPAPSFGSDWRSISGLPEQVSSWYDDHIGFRRDLIRLQSLLEIEIFGTAPTRTLIVGKQGWFFFGDADAVASYRGVARLAEPELRRWQQVLEERQHWLAEQGIAFLVVLVPDKHLVYPEYMPDRLPRVSDRNPLGQLAEYLSIHSSVDLLDLRPALAEARSRERIYQRTDTHWNDIGAYAAYRAILGRLALRVPALAGTEPAPVRFERREGPGLGLASIVGLASVYREELLELHLVHPRARVKREYRAGYDERVRRMLPIAHGVEDQSLPRAVMFRDSFANALVPYLSEHFRRILYIWDRDVDPQVVALERPDVVIQEIASRFLVRPPRGIGELQAVRER